MLENVPKEETRKKSTGKNICNLMSTRGRYFKMVWSRPILSPSYDLPKNRNCQLSAISKILRSIGIHRSNQTTREEIVRYLDNNPCLPNTAYQPNAPSSSTRPYLNPDICRKSYDKLYHKHYECVLICVPR